MRYEPVLHIVLHEPEIPPNAGNVGRTCVAIAAKMWLVKPLGFSLDDYYMRRAGLDYWDELEWEAVDNQAALDRRLAESGAGERWLFSARATQVYTSVAFQRSDVLVFGSESKGLPDWLKAEHADRLLKIHTPIQAPRREPGGCREPLGLAVGRWGRFEWLASSPLLAQRGFYRLCDSLPASRRAGTCRCDTLTTRPPHTAAGAGNTPRASRCRSRW